MAGFPLIASKLEGLFDYVNDLSLKKEENKTQGNVAKASGATEVLLETESKI